MKNRSILILMIMIMIVSLNGCFMRPYMVPKYIEINNNETAFVVPLESNSNDQKKFKSKEYLESKKVAAKRILIPQRWIQTGRFFADAGKYIETVRVLKVLRSPVSREWTPDTTSGTSKNNEALYAESKDSIGISSGFCITAWIEEPDTALFLYKFQGNSLSIVLDSIIRQTVQAEYTKMCALYDLNELRGKKGEITDQIRKIVVPKYKKMGITIDPSLGLVGGLIYENKEIQKSIDQVFKDQQIEKSNRAKKNAQIQENERLLAIQENEKKIAIVKAEADAQVIIKKAKAEAESIKVIAKELNNAGEMYIKIKQLEVLDKGLNQWQGGKVLDILVNGAGGNMLQHLFLNENKKNNRGMQ